MLNIVNTTVVSGFTADSTTFGFLNTYSSIPNIGYGFDFINSNYATTLANSEMLIDITLTAKQSTYATIMITRTQNTVQQLSINYIVCQSTFFLDIRNTYFDLTSETVFTTTSTNSKTSLLIVPYKTKSNSSNAIVVYNTIGLHMIRTSRTF